MPTTFDSLSGLTIHSCSRCHRASALDNREERNAEADRRFRWHSGSARYVSRCRDCERLVRQETAQARREGRTTGRRGRTIVNADRRFGVELECIFPSNVSRHDVTSALNAAGVSAHWRVISDGSLTANGLEVVSPPLQGDEGLEAVTKVCRVLKEIGARINNSCGTHVHHEIRDLDMPAIRRFAHTWANNQHLIDGLVSEGRRNNGNIYCHSFTRSDAAQVDQVNDLRHLYLNRYKTVNFTAFPRHGTVEVRQHQGTLNAEKIRSWVKLGQAMIATAAAETEPVSRHESVLAFLEALSNRIDQTARTFLLGRAVEFGYAAVSSTAPTTRVV